MCVYVCVCVCVRASHGPQIRGLLVLHLKPGHPDHHGVSEEVRLQLAVGQQLVALSVAAGLKLSAHLAAREGVSVHMLPLPPAAPLVEDADGDGQLHVPLQPVCVGVPHLVELDGYVRPRSGTEPIGPHPQGHLVPPSPRVERRTPPLLAQLLQLGELPDGEVHRRDAEV